jgi:hypothetical protein
MGKLIMVGRKLAVLGVDQENPLRPWHIMQPGRHAIPQVGDAGKTIGTTLCGRWAITNGYAADFAPQGQELCPACSERV